MREIRLVRLSHVAYFDALKLPSYLDKTLQTEKTFKEKSLVILTAKETLDHAADVTCIFGVDPECNGNDGVQANAHAALQVVALSVLDQVVDNQHTQEEDDSLEALEVKSHLLAHDPSEDDKEWGNEEGDLHGTSNGNADSEVHLVLVCDDHGGDVLGSVSDNRKENETDESLADTRGSDDGVDRSNEIFGANSNEDRDQNQSNTGCDRSKHFWLVLLAVTALLGLGVEQACVCLQLENEVKNVEEQHDDRSSTRENQNVVHGVGAALGKSSVHGGRNDQASGGNSHQRRHGRCHSLVEGALLATDSGSNEAASKNEQDIGQD